MLQWLVRFPKFTESSILFRKNWSFPEEILHGIQGIRQINKTWILVNLRIFCVVGCVVTSWTLHKRLQVRIIISIKLWLNSINSINSVKKTLKDNQIANCQNVWSFLFYVSQHCFTPHTETITRAAFSEVQSTGRAALKCLVSVATRTNYTQQASLLYSVKCHYLQVKWPPSVKSDCCFLALYFLQAVFGL